MWKLLRNLTLAALLLAGALKLLAWYAVGQDAQRVITALAPYAQVQYNGLSAGLDGSVSLSGVTVTRTASHAQYRANRVLLDSPGLVWLLRHALLHKNSLPAQFGVSVRGLALPATLPWLNVHWFNPVTFVPFDNAGCDDKSFSAADYATMGVTAGKANQRLEYLYDVQARTLDLTLTLSAPAFATVVLDAELRKFDPRTLQAHDFLDNLHIDQLSADYTDAGFLQRRNLFCARRAGISARQFGARHIAAMQALLKQHGMVASSELIGIYRQLIEHGGAASILSLPNANFAASAWRTHTPDDVLRQLNVTARYRDTPPVMFRLSFAPPPQVPADAVASAIAEPAIAMPPPPPVRAKSPPTITPDTKPALAAKAVTPSLAVIAPVVAVVPKSVASAARAHNSLGLRSLDRAEAKLAPAPVVTALPPTPPPAHVPELASSAPPPPNSTLALVWKPTIERLPEAAPEHHDYSIIEYAGLLAVIGRRVRLITEGGKRVEGEVISVDPVGVQVRVNRGGGDAQFSVPKSRIHQIQLLRRWASAQ